MKIIEKMDNNFVENYEDLIKYKKNIDGILDKMGIEGFNSYNDFCIKIRKNAIDKIKNENINYLDSDTDFFSRVINKTLRDQIRSDKDYTGKLSEYFEDENLIEILKKDQ